MQEIKTFEEYRITENRGANSKPKMIPHYILNFLFGEQARKNTHFNI